MVRMFIMHLYPPPGKTRGDKETPLPFSVHILPEVGIWKRETPILPSVMENGRKRPLSEPYRRESRGKRRWWLFFPYSVIKILKLRTLTSDHFH